MANSLESTDFSRSRAEQHFNTVAPNYSEYRKPSEQILDIISQTTSFQHKKILDVGCGPGHVVTVMREKYHFDAYGVDASQQMAAHSLQKDVLTIGRAEQLPFPTATFDGATSMMAVHLFDRVQAFSEIHRILKPSGQFVITSVDTNNLEKVWLQKFFPSYAAIEKKRLPSVTTLDLELRTGGFEKVEYLPYLLKDLLARESILEKLRRKVYSSLMLISEEEYQQGLKKAEDTVPEEMIITLPLVFVYATRY